MNFDFEYEYDIKNYEEFDKINKDCDELYNMDLGQWLIWEEN